MKPSTEPVGGHSPGPWRADLFADGAFKVEAPCDHPYVREMVVAARNVIQSKAIESHANARLIAASPDLLRAAEEARDLLVSMWGVESGGKSGAVRDRLIEAIRKATGEAARDRARVEAALAQGDAS